MPFVSFGLGGVIFPWTSMTLISQNTFIYVHIYLFMSEINTRAPGLLNKLSTTELYPQP